MSVSKIFMSICIFWLILLAGFSMFGYTLNQNSGYNDGLTDDKLSANSMNILNFGDSVTFIFKVMFWSVPAEYGIPQWVSILLNLYGLASIFVFVMWIRGIGTTG